MALLKRPYVLLILAVIWMMLQDVYTIPSFVGGLLVAVLVLVIFPIPMIVNEPIRPDSPPRLLRKAYRFIRLILYFLRELLVANWAVIRLVLAPRVNLKPGIFAMRLRVQKPGQIALLANLISLTPGTLTLEISQDHETAFIHAIDATDETAALAVPRRFEEMIMEVIP
jgi:multicomponent Na+:H+ antiporter subunit E